MENKNSQLDPRRANEMARKIVGGAPEGRVLYLKPRKVSLMKKTHDFLLRALSEEKSLDPVLVHRATNISPNL